MHCLKCGREIEDRGVFCPDCLGEMKKYPVRPGTVVRLPQRNAVPVDKKRQQRHRLFIKNADQITMLRSRCRWLTVALIFTFVCFLAAAFLLMWLLEWHKYVDLPLPSLAALCAECFT